MSEFRRQRKRNPQPYTDVSVLIIDRLGAKRNKLRIKSVSNFDDFVKHVFNFCKKEFGVDDVNIVNHFYKYFKYYDNGFGEYVDFNQVENKLGDFISHKQNAKLKLKFVFSPDKGAKPKITEPQIPQDPKATAPLYPLYPHSLQPSYNVSVLPVSEEKDTVKPKMSEEKDAVKPKMSVPEKPERFISSKIPSLVGLEKKILLDKKIVVAFVGSVSSGKSSLINFMMSGKPKWVCPSAHGRCTKSFTSHSYTEEVITEEKAREIKAKIMRKNDDSSEANDDYDEKIIEFKSFNNSDYKNIIFLDTPGIDDRLTDDRLDLSQDCSLSRVLGSKYVDAIVYLVSPDKIHDARELHLLKSLCELNPNIVVALSKYDQIIDDIFEECDNSDQVNEYFLKQLIEDCKVFQDLGCDVVPVQVKKPIEKERCIYFDVALMTKVLERCMEPKKGSYIDIRNRLRKECVGRWKPISFSKHYSKTFKEAFKNDAILWSVGLGIAGVVVGGLSLIALGPLLGTVTVGTMTSVLAGVGGGAGMLAGLGVIGGTTIAVAGGAVGLVALVGGKSVSMGVAKWLYELPNCAMSALSIIDKDVGLIIKKTKVKHEVYKSLKEYEKVGRVKNEIEYTNDKMKVMKTMKNIEDLQYLHIKCLPTNFMIGGDNSGVKHFPQYEDFIVVKLGGDIYLVKCIFRGLHYKGIIDIRLLEK